MARARSTDSFLLRASQAAGATGSDQRKRPRRSTSPLSSRVSHTPATCWGLKFKMGSWNIDAALAAAGALSGEQDTQQTPTGPAGCARLSSVNQFRAAGDTAGGTLAVQLWGASEREGLEEMPAPAPRLRFGSTGLGHAGGRAGISTGVGGLAARAPWRPPVSHWPALPIKTATRASRPFQHLPALDSARRFPWTFPQYFTEPGGGKDLRESGRKRGESSIFSTRLPPPQTYSSVLPPFPRPQRDSDAAGIPFGEMLCLGQEVSRGQRGLARSKSYKNSSSVVVTKRLTVWGAHQWAGRGSGSPHFSAPFPTRLSSFSSCQRARWESNLKQKERPGDL